ncbi:MAG: hypothetical protein R3E65_09595 [Steroidobacteraceae bacterium]
MTESVPTLDFAVVDTPAFAREIFGAYQRYGFVVGSRPWHRCAWLTREFLAAYEAFFCAARGEPASLPRARRRRRTRLHAVRHRDR